MNTYTEKTEKDRAQSVAVNNTKKPFGTEAVFQLENNRQELPAQKDLQEAINGGRRTDQITQLVGAIDYAVSSQDFIQREVKDMAGAKSLKSEAGQTIDFLQSNNLLERKVVQKQADVDAVQEQSAPIQRNRAVARRGAKGAAGGAVGGAILGSIIGSFIPGAGTLLGAGIGAAVGAGLGLVSSLIKDAFEARARRRIANLYGLEVSADISGVILKKIEGVLASLPTAHTKGNASLTDVNSEGDGNVSSYDGQDTISVVNPMGMPDILYAMLNKQSGWQRRLMDDGAMPEFDEAIDTAYGLNSDDRHVMAGVSDANSQENLLTWTMRHEIGHSVDRQIGWEANMKGQPVCAGWHNETEDNVFIQFLAKHNIGANVYNAMYQLNQVQQVPLIQMLQNLTGGTVADFLASQRWQAFVAGTPGVPGGINNLVIGLIRSFDIAKNHPWTFDNGGGNDLDHAGRTYMQGQYGEWESYLTAARGSAVSNYQFSSSGEWFAEAYAAYYNPEPNAASRARLSAAERLWFATNIGLHSGDQNFNQAAIHVQPDANGDLELQ